MAKTYKWLEKTGKGMYKTLFYMEILIILIEGYLELIIATFLQIQSNIVKYYWISFFISIVIFVIMPMIIFYIITRKQECLEHAHIKDKFGAFYAQFKTDNRGNLIYYFMFFLRRFVFCMAVFTTYMRKHGGILLIMLCLFFLGAGMYVGYFEPFKVRRENKLELMNEMFFGCHLYMMMCYTDFVLTGYG
jgi:hypothetical protein